MEFYLVISAVLVIFVVSLFYRANIRAKKLPPGPFRWPLIGNIFNISTDIRTVFRRLRRKHGDVFSLQLGNRLYVIVNGYETIREMFVEREDDFSDRADMFSLRTMSHQGKGVVSSCGDQTSPLRQVCHRSINNKDKVREYLMEGLEALDVSLQKNGGQTFDIHSLLLVSVGNILSGLMSGETVGHNDRHFQTFIALLDENVRLTKITGILDIFPSLIRVPGDLFKAKKLEENTNRTAKFCASLIEKCKNDPGRDCMINDFLKAIKEKGKLGDPYSDAHLLYSVNGMFSAGLQIPCLNLEWAILHLINHEHLQETLRTEVIKCVGNSGYPSEDIREGIPQCAAFVEEVLRYYNVTQFAVPHGTRRDTSFRGFVIPKGSIIIPNVDSVHADPNSFPHHDVFNHERFLSSDGSFVPNERVISFGVGKRRCLGYNTARTVLLVLVAFFVQRYKLLPAEDGMLPLLKGKMSFTHDPPRFLMRVKRIE